MRPELENLLRTRGPSLSTDLAALLVKRHGLTPTAARKRISRPSAEVRRLAFIKFPRNARFLYLQDHFGSDQYWDNLISALLQNNSAYGLALTALRQRGGIMPVNHFAIACGAPIRQKQHLAAEAVLARLTQAKLVGEHDVPGVGPCIALLQGAGRYDEANTEIRARLIVEKILLDATATWLKNLGIASYGKIATRDSSSKQNKVGTFYWDLTAPSYLAPVTQRDANGHQKPGFVACDVLLGIQVSEEGLRPFINKCTMLRALRNVGRCLQIFIADHFAPEAFKLAKQKGIIPATPETLFGKEVAEGLVELFEVLRDAANFAVDPQKFALVFERLSRIEGAAINLRGVLFEYLVAEILRRDVGGFVRIGRTYTLPNGDKAQADVVVEKQNVSITFVECKGYQSAGTVSVDYIERWLTVVIPRLYEYARNHSEWKNLSVRFEFWTSGKLSPDAQRMFASAASQVRKYVIALRDSDGMREAAEATEDNALIKVFKEHFVEHPLATIEQEANRRHVRRARSLASKEASTPEKASLEPLIESEIVPATEPSDLPF